MAKTQPRATTPDEEGIELLPDAMERLEHAIKTAARHGPILSGSIKKPKPKKVATRRR